MEIMPEQSNCKKPAENSEDEFSYYVASKLAILIDMSFDSGFPSTIGQDEAVASTILSGGAYREGERVLVALSGGPDSTALLNALAESASDFGFRLAACHVNHHTRGKESDEDEKFCEILCDKLKVKLYIRHVSLANHKGRPSEAMLRDARYSLLLDAASQYGSHFVALAHTLDDQIETVLFRLFRGSSMSGVSGMPPFRYLNRDVVIVRPMLDLTRAQCLNYLNFVGMNARDDSSNKDERYNRNYLRQVVVPLINERFPGFALRVANFCETAKAEEDLLNQIARERLAHLKDDNDCRWSLALFLTLPLAIKRRVVALSMRERHIEVNFERVEKILWLANPANHEKEKAMEKPAYGQQFLCQLPEGRKNLALSLNGRWDVRVEKEEIVWVDKSIKPMRLSNDFRLKVPGITPIPQLGLALKIEEWDVTEPVARYPEETGLASFVDLTGTRFPLILRSRRSGDVIQPFGMKERVRLKKYLHTHKRQSGLINGLERSHAGSVVIADQEEVIWVPGIGLSEKVKVGGRPTHILQFIAISPDQLDWA